MLSIKNNYINNVLLLLLLIFSLRCNLDTTQKKNDKDNDKYVQKIMDLIVKPDQDKVALLSIKYNLDLELTEKILDEYLTENDFDYNRMKDISKTNASASDKDPLPFMTRDKYAINKSIIEISNNNDVDVWKVTNIIIEYLKWSDCETIEK